MKPAWTQTRPRYYPDCKECDNARVKEDPSGRVLDCTCVIRAKMREYLTPHLANALWIKPADGFDTAPLLGCSVLVQNEGNRYRESNFTGLYKSALKSFLMNTRGEQHFHVCLGAKEVADALYGDDPALEGVYETLERVQLLVLVLSGDPPNRHYPQLLLSLLRHRAMLDMPSWVVTGYSLTPNDGMIDQIYGRDVGAYIRPRPVPVGGKPEPGEFVNLDLRRLEAARQRVTEAA